MKRGRSFKCPNCGYTTRITRWGDWIKDKVSYDAFWKDIPTSVKLSIEDYFSLNGRDPRKYTLNFTTEHNEAEWPEVKKAFQELRVSGFVYDFYIS